jgi:hypothetical protein
MFGSRLNLPDAVVVTKPDLSFWHTKVEVVVAHPPVLKGTDGLLDDRLPDIRARDGVTRS